MHSNIALTLQHITSPQHTEIHSAPDSQVGTPSYFAPEVVEQKRYDGRVADIWSCGVMLYVMLYGAYPFERAEDSKLTPAKAQQALLNVRTSRSCCGGERVGILLVGRVCMPRPLVQTALYCLAHTDLHILTCTYHIVHIPTCAYHVKTLLVVSMLSSTMLCPFLLLLSAPHPLHNAVVAHAHVRTAHPSD